MMEDDSYTLKWNNHMRIYCDVLSRYKENSKFTDCVIAVDSKFYNVHKFVLSTCSEYFNEILELITSQSPVIVLKDVNHKDIEALLDYMYIGTVNVSKTQLPSLFKTAQLLKINGLQISEVNIPQINIGDQNVQENTIIDEESPPSKKRRHDGSSKSPKSESHDNKLPVQNVSETLPLSQKVDTNQPTKADKNLLVNKLINEDHNQSTHNENIEPEIEITENSGIILPSFFSNNSPPAQVMNEIFVKEETLNSDYDPFTEDSLALNDDPSFNKYIGFMDEMKMQISQLTANVNTLMMMQCSNDDDIMPEGIHFPLTSLEEVDEAENWLLQQQNKLLQKNIVSILARIGGQDIKSITWNILSHVFTNSLAKQINWKGGGQYRKRSFSQLSLKSLIIRSVRQNERAASATDQEIIKQLIRWFSLAGDRDGGRKARAEKKNNSLLNIH